jgi:hypothetical protein
MTMPVCARPGCFKTGTKMCSACLREPYCSGECQNIDWKSHKLICKTLKKLSRDLQPYAEVDRILWEIDEVQPNANRRILDHVLSYSQYQFGNRILQQSYRQRENGEMIDNYEVEIVHMIRMYRDLIDDLKQES